VTAALLIGFLVTAGVYLILQRGLVRMTFGFVLLGHAVNILLLASGGMQRRGVAVVGQSEAADTADPVPQAFALTAIVITFAITTLLLALAWRGTEVAEGDVPETGPGADDHVDDRAGRRQRVVDREDSA
jgi:multicomponent Na+:H+ antiporter subunit C